MNSIERKEMKINLIEFFESTADSFPEKLALVDATTKLKFKELRHRAKSIAVAISNTSGVINRPVAIYLPKCNDAIATFIGTMYSGNCYAPLDTKNPINRVKAIIEALEPSCIVTNTNFSG